jgi:hypothetical protein
VYNVIQRLVLSVLLHRNFIVIFIAGTLYEIQESESDDENKISEELPEAWIDNDISFIDNVHNF